MEGNGAVVHQGVENSPVGLFCQQLLVSGFV